VAAPEFYFALEFSSQGVPAGLLGELASQVLDHLGCRDGSAPDLPEALQEAVASGVTSAGDRCDVQFRAHGGTLEILVSRNGGRIWQASRHIP
jgi:hypothetical protein